MRYRNCDRNRKRFGWHILHVINSYIQYIPPIFHLFPCAVLYYSMQTRQYYSSSLSLFGSVAVQPTPTADVTIAPDQAFELKL